LEDLFNPVNILLHIFNVAVLYAVLYYFLYKPIKKYMGARSDRIKKQIDEARQTQEKAEAAFAESREKLKEAEKEAAAAVSKGTQQAQNQAAQMLRTVKAEADEIVRQARKETDELRNNTRESMRDEAASLAISIAGMVLGREISLDDNMRLINDFIGKVK
jgi:F-type H+-transporting ATPase subunit b